MCSIFLLGPSFYIHQTAVLQSGGWECACLQDSAASDPLPPAKKTAQSMGGRGEDGWNSQCNWGNMFFLKTYFARLVPMRYEFLKQYIIRKSTCMFCWPRWLMEICVCVCVPYHFGTYLPEPPWKKIPNGFQAKRLLPTSSHPRWFLFAYAAVVGNATFFEKNINTFEVWNKERPI